MIRTNRLNSISVLVSHCRSHSFCGKAHRAKVRKLIPNKNSPMNTNVYTTSQSRYVREKGSAKISRWKPPTRRDNRYDCAHGALRKDCSRGGRKVRSRESQARARRATRDDEDDGSTGYLSRGSIKDETMTLTVELADNKEAVGTFTLTQGKTGRIRKCM